MPAQAARGTGSSSHRRSEPCSATASLRRHPRPLRQICCQTARYCRSEVQPQDPDSIHPGRTAQRRPPPAVPGGVREMIFFPKLAVPGGAVPAPLTDPGPPMLLVFPVPGLISTKPATETDPDATFPKTCVWLVPSKVTRLLPALT